MPRAIAKLRQPLQAARAGRPARIDSARIVKAAIEIGLARVTIKEVALRLGVTAPALYRHFDSKEQVLLEVVREAYERFARHLYLALQGSTPLERFELAGDGAARGQT